MTEFTTPLDPDELKLAAGSTTTEAVGRITEALKTIRLFAQDSIEHDGDTRSTLANLYGIRDAVDNLNGEVDFRALSYQHRALLSERTALLERLERAERDRDEAREDIGPPTPLGALKFRMEQGGHTQADLAKLLGSRSRASEILSGKREMSKEHIAILVDNWGIPARSLLGPDQTRWKARAQAAETKLATLTEALKDALAGWRYIRRNHGDLYGVGWDRVEESASAALAQTQEEKT